MCVHVCHITYVEVRGHPVGVSSLLPSLWIWGMELQSLGLVSGTLTYWYLFFFKLPVFVVSHLIVPFNVNV